MVSWQGPYLAKDCRPDFNNGLRGDSNSGPILAPGVYWSPTRIIAPPQAISILSYICSCLPLMVSWQVPFAKGCRLDFNNGLGGDSNSGPISPGGYSNLTRIMAPPQAISMSDGTTSVYVSYLWFLGRYHTWPRAAGLTSIMVSDVIRIVAPF